MYCTTVNDSFVNLFVYPQYYSSWMYDMCAVFSVPQFRYTVDTVHHCVREHK